MGSTQQGLFRYLKMLNQKARGSFWATCILGTLSTGYLGCMGFLRLTAVRAQDTNCHPGQEPREQPLPPLACFWGWWRTASSCPVTFSSDTCLCCEASGNILSHMLMLIQGANAIPIASSGPLPSGPGVLEWSGFWLHNFPHLILRACHIASCPQVLINGLKIWLETVG